MIALYGQGMHAFVLRELEIGKRAAAAEDDEYCGWSALDDLSYAAYEKRLRDETLAELLRRQE